MAGFSVEIGGFCALHGLQSLFHSKTGRALFLDNRELAVAGGTEGFYGFGVEDGVIGSAVQGQRSENFARVGVHHDHHAGRGRAAGDEEDAIFCVERKAGGGGVFVAEVEAGGDLHRLCVNHGNVAFILNIDPNVAFSVGHGLFRRAFEVDRSHYRAIGGIDHCIVRGAVADDVDAVVEGVENNAVGSAFNVDSFDQGLGFGVPHGNGFAAGEAVVRLGVEGGSASVGVGNFARGGEGVEVEDGDAGRRPVVECASWNLEAAAVGVGIDVVKAPGSATLAVLRIL